MAFMVVAIVVIFCLRWLCGEFAPCRCDVGRRCNLCERAGFWGARVAGTARAMRCAPRAPPVVRRAHLGSEMRFFARGYLVAPRAGAFTQPFLAGSEGMGSGGCARARAVLVQVATDAELRGCLSTVWPSLARNYVAWCVIRKFDFQPPPRTPGSEGRAAPTASEPLKELSVSSLLLWLAELDAGRRVWTCPDLARRFWTP